MACVVFAFYCSDSSEAKTTQIQKRIGKDLDLITRLDSGFRFDKMF